MHLESESNGSTISYGVKTTSTILQFFHNRLKLFFHRSFFIHQGCQPAASLQTFLQYVEAQGASTGFLRDPSRDQTHPIQPRFVRKELTEGVLLNLCRPGLFLSGSGNHSKRPPNAAPPSGGLSSIKWHRLPIVNYLPQIMVSVAIT